MTDQVSKLESQPPARIYLQWLGADKDELTAEELREPAPINEMTWCQHKIHDTDIEYVLAASQPSVPATETTELAERLAARMGYPATADLVLQRVNNKQKNPNLIDAMWAEFIAGVPSSQGTPPQEKNTMNITKELHELCVEIEKLPASAQQTLCSIKASELLKAAASQGTEWASVEERLPEEVAEPSNVASTEDVFILYEDGGKLYPGVSRLDRGKWLWERKHGLNVRYWRRFTLPTPPSGETT